MVNVFHFVSSSEARQDLNLLIVFELETKHRDLNSIEEWRQRKALSKAPRGLEEVSRPAIDQRHYPW